MHPAPLIEAFANLDRLLANNASGKPLPLLEGMFEISHSHKGGFKPFIQGLIESEFWKKQNFQNNPFPRLCMDLSFEIDLKNASMEPKEPPYHCRGHFQDVCLAITLLLQQPVNSSNETPDRSLWLMSPKEAWLLLFCAIGHDFGHNGSVNQTPFQLERASIEKIRSFLQKSTVNQELVSQIMPRVETIILATDPSAFDNLVSKFSDTTPVFTKEDCMSMLLVEADLMGSALPKHGVRMGQQLFDEWREKNFELAQKVISAEGRIGFLKHIQFISPQSQKLGIDKIRQESINQMKK